MIMDSTYRRRYPISPVGPRLTVKADRLSGGEA
jgi:hypothetical protein